MAETDYVEPLTGEEIIIDLCSQIADRLRKDCNLRDSDSYPSGYSAKVTVHVEAYGMDQATVDMSLSVGAAQADPSTVIDTEIEVPVETALDQVRERSDQPIPTLSMEEGVAVIKPRRYVRPARLAGGGAMAEKL
jgi:hypothetical protein